jgi:CheY-like chemotaxis protein
MKQPSKRTALVARDAKDATALVGLLSGLGWEAVVVCSWTEAERLVQREHFDVMITDYFFGDSEGLDLITKWREREIRLRVLFVSDDPFRGRIPIEEFGFSGLALKPLCCEKLKVALTKLLETGGAAGAEWS